MTNKPAPRGGKTYSSLLILSLASFLLSTGCKPSRSTVEDSSPALVFDVTGCNLARPDTNSHSSPAVIIEFSHPVKAEDTARFLEFRNRTGRRLPAVVRQLLAWEQPGRWELRLPDSFGITRVPPELSWTPELATPTNPAPQYILVKPRQPLPVGQGWCLRLAARLPSSERGLSLRQDREIPVGDVTPFTLVSWRSEHVVNQGPSMSFQFSKRVSAAVTNHVEDWLRLEPAVNDLSVELADDTLTLRGDFLSDQPYAITFLPAFSAEEPFRLGASRRVDIIIPHVAPRLYFPAFSIDQYAGGTRSFSLLAVNVPRTLIRAKLVDHAGVVHVLRGYDGYFRSWRDSRSGEGRFKRIDYSLVPGRTIFTRELQTGRQLDDVARTCALSWDDILGRGNKGLVLLEAERISDSEEPTLGAQALVQVTDLGMLWKASHEANQLAVAVFSYRTGCPIPGAEVQLLSNENEVLGTSRTDESGFAHLDSTTNAGWISAHTGEDTHTLKLTDHWLFHWSPDYPGGYENPDGRRIMLFTERPLYRPGETLHLKAIARDYGPGGLAIPEPFSGALSVWDARNRKVLETNLNFAASGSASLSTAFDSPSRGEYRVSLELTNQQYQASFRVEEFKPNAFEVKLQTLPDAEREVRASVTARYLFGKPITQAKVKWFLVASPEAFSPAGFDDYQFTLQGVDPALENQAGPIALSGETNLSHPDVILSAALPAMTNNTQPRECYWSVAVTDASQQTVAASTSFLRHSSEFYLGIRPEAQVVNAGENLEFDLVAVGTNGMVWAESVPTTVTVRKLDWRSSRLEAAGGILRFHNEPIVTLVTNLNLNLPAAGPSNTGPIRCRVPSREAGQYIIEVAARDRQSRLVAASASFHVSEARELAWNYRNEVQLELKADQPGYCPGEKAKLLVEAPFSGTAIVTVERDRLLRSFTTKLEGNAPSILVPLEPDDVPNVFVTVTLVRGAENSPRTQPEPTFRFGSCMLKVEDPFSRLSTKVETASTSYQPGDEVEVRVNVTDAAGHPAADADLALYAVDEGVLSLMEDPVPDPVTFFYQPRPLAVMSSISLRQLLPEDPTELRFHNKGYVGGDGGRLSRARKNFLACAFWSGNLLTDSAGTARARFTAPDSLTRYRVVAVVSHGAQRFGTASTDFEVKKPLIVEPALPRFACATDRLLARALVHNQTITNGQIEVSLELDRTATHLSSLARTNLAPAVRVLSHTLAVPSGGTVPVDFPVELVSPGQARWVWRARFTEVQPGFTDAVESNLEISHPAPLLRQVVNETIDAPEHRTAVTPVSLLRNVDGKLLSCTSTVTVHLATTRLGDLGQSVSQLLKYPYGCAEQTCSSLLPWVVLSPTSLGSNLANMFRLPSTASDAVKAGVQRLLAMQTDNGGIGYWPGDRDPTLFTSAYAALTFSLARRSGMAVPESEYTNLLAYISRSLRNSEISGQDRALALYALALADQPEPAYHENLFAARAKLTPEARALLALAVLESRGPNSMAATLLSSERQSPRVPNEDYFGSQARTLAVQLLGWVDLAFRDPRQRDRAVSRIDRLLSDLLRERIDGHWQTTQGNAWALFAVIEYAKLFPQSAGTTEGQLLSYGREVPFQLGPDKRDFTHSVLVRQAGDEGNPAKAALVVAGGGPLYATITVETRPLTNSLESVDEGFSLHRGYHSLTDSGEVRPAEGLTVGDRVLVTLEVVARDEARYVALEDRLPANLEVVRKEFKTSGAQGFEVRSGKDSSNVRDWHSDFQEVRGDSIRFFCNHLSPGTYRVQYLARVTAAGTAAAPAAKVEEMYHPERHGLSKVARLSTQPLSTH